MEKNGLDEAEVYVKNILDWDPEDREARGWWARIMGPAPSLIASNAQLQIVKLPDGQEISMKLVPGSTFNMGDTWGDGDEKPVHAITVFDFWMTTTEITNQQYATFLNARGNQFEGAATWLDINDEDCQIVIKDGFFVGRAGFENNPVVEVTWFGARAFARWVRGRLPTEAEWEYAARNGGRNMKFATGADLSSDDANILGTMGRDRWEPSSPVASFASKIYSVFMIYPAMYGNGVRTGMPRNITATAGGQILQAPWAARRASFAAAHGMIVASYAEYPTGI